MKCVDFGSGHNPRRGFITCDNTGLAELYYNEDTNEIDGLNDKVDMFYMRNVVHHLPSISRVVECMKKYLTEHGKIVIVEPKKEAYAANIFLDVMWYRGILKNDRIKIFNYRDYDSIIKKDFNIKKKTIVGCKEITLYKRR